MTDRERQTIHLIRRANRIDPVVTDDQIADAYRGTLPWAVYGFRAAITITARRLFRKGTR